jgi:hypothetical protein
MGAKAGRAVHAVRPSLLIARRLFNLTIPINSVAGSLFAAAIIVFDAMALINEPGGRAALKTGMGLMRGLSEGRGQFPLSGVWTVGILLRVEMFVVGLIMVTTGSAARSISKTQAEEGRGGRET